MKYLIQILVIFMELVCNVRCLEATNKPGYCIAWVSFTISSRVPYMETYKVRTMGIFYQTKYRWNYKIEYRPFWKTEERCCFMYEKRNDECLPTCIRDCGKGDCVSPNVCSCHKGYKSRAFGSSPVCIPDCEQDCVHGSCTAPDTCTCDDGYSLEPNNKFACKPNCKNCEHGVCVLPGVCICEKGYTLNPLTQNCEPVCSEPCPKNVCIAPDTCMCEKGFGFLTNDTNVCEPICTKQCVNGFCAKPNVCECHEGFVKDWIGSHVCKPKCNLTCEPNGRCVAPNVCVCEDGYELVDRNDGSIHFSDEPICKPICEPSCWAHSKCTAPNRCLCNKGYKLTIGKDNSVKSCEPICEEKCVEGFCSEPNVCSCNLGYEKLDKNVCTPICEPSCWPHSSCTAPNRCTCDKHYELTMGRDNTSRSCEPICKEECVNGFCSSPDKCTCYLGYVKSGRNICKPVCELPCQRYSSCTAPGTCTCNEGYESKTNDDDSLSCEPICEPPCPENGICSKPGSCVCEDGYRSLEEDETKICSPVCDLDCANGTCTAPNVCTCDLGYVNNEIGTCIPYCAKDCGNGTCIGPDICECYEGYTVGNESLICEPYCENDCEHGECVNPNECLCNVGYLKNSSDVDSVCISACKNSCNGKGDCIDDQGHCECYFGWHGESCEDATVCVVVVTDENQLYETLSIAKEPNFSMILAGETNPVCQQCLNEVNNQTICYEFRYDLEEGNSSIPIVCFVDTNSICYSEHSPSKEVLKVSAAVGGLTILIVIVSICFACYKFRRQRAMAASGKRS